MYGFKNEKELKKFLQNKSIILDSGCGLGYKAKWLSDLAPNSLVIGMDLSTSIHYAARIYNKQPNLFFFQGNIAILSVRKSDPKSITE